MAPDEVIVARAVEERPKTECEVIFLVGLPSSGKTRWATQLMRDHPEKNYMILSNRQIFNQMKLLGPFAKDRAEDVNRQCSAILASILTDNPRKPQTARNYIIDQPNLYQSARRRRLRLFKGFSKEAVVFCPPEEKYAEYRALAAQENNFDAVSDEEVAKLAENFEVPVVSSVEFDRVTFVDTSAEGVEAMAARYRERARESKKRGPEEASSEQKEPFLPPGLDELPDYAAMANYQAYLLQQHLLLQAQLGEEQRLQAPEQHD